MDRGFRQDVIQHSRYNYELVMHRLQAPRKILLSKAIEDVAVVLITAAAVREIGPEPPKNPRVSLSEAGADYGREPAEYQSLPLAGGVDGGNRRMAGDNQKQEKSGAGGGGGKREHKKQASTPPAGGSSLELLGDNELAALTRTPFPGWPRFRHSANGQQFLEDNESLWTTAKDFFAPNLPLNSQALTEMTRTVGTRSVLPGEMWDIRETKGVHHMYHGTHYARYIKMAQSGRWTWSEAQPKGDLYPYLAMYFAGSKEYALWWAFSAEAISQPGSLTSLSTLRGIVLEKVIGPGTKLVWAHHEDGDEYERFVRSNLATSVDSIKLHPPAPVLAGRFLHREREHLSAYDFFSDNLEDLIQVAVLPESDALLSAEPATVKTTSTNFGIL